MLLGTQPLAPVRSDEEEGAGEADGEEPTALQLRLKGENLVKISPEYQLEWIRTVQELKQDHLLHLSKADAAVGYNNLAPEDWDALRREVLRIAARKPKADKQERLERVMGNKTRMFLYAACISQRCADHGLVTHGPWARYVEKALRIPKHSLKWSNCLGIYVLLSHPGATPCGWHTDFSPDAPARDAYLHKVVNVFIPLQDMTERMGFTVVLDREKGRCQIPARQQGQWYALDPGYPHAADGYPVAEGEKAEALPPRMLLNISYIRRDFPPALRKHVVSYGYFYRAHLPPEVWRDR